MPAQEPRDVPGSFGTGLETPNFDSSVAQQFLDSLDRAPEDIVLSRLLRHKMSAMTWSSVASQRLPQALGSSYYGILVSTPFRDFICRSAKRLH